MIEDMDVNTQYFDGKEHYFAMSAVKLTNIDLFFSWANDALVRKNYLGRTHPGMVRIPMTVVNPESFISERTAAL